VSISLREGEREREREEGIRRQEKDGRSSMLIYTARTKVQVRRAKGREMKMINVI